MKVHKLWIERNQDKNKELTANWRANNKDRITAHNLKKIGATPEQKQRLLEDQDYKCSCCSKDLQDLPSRQIHLDHDHETGKLRGVLCQKCNTTLGLLGDSLQAVEESCAMYGRYLRE
jgi:DNA-directed RNA polymerase subunit RPC12/RpoP